MEVKQKGSVIIEALIAAFIFAAALLTLIEFQTNLLGDRSLTSQQAAALTLAQDKMQSFRHYTTFNDYDNIASGTSTIAKGNADYTILWTVTPATAPARKAVDITVTWKDAKNVTYNIKLSSIIARIDPTAAGKVSQHLP